MSEKLIISRIQQRRGTRETVPSPLSEAELGLATDSGQVFMGDQDLAPFGIRAFSPQISIVKVNTQLSDRTVSMVFDSTLNSVLFDQLKAHFLRSLPVDPAVYPNARFLRLRQQLRWDGNRTVFLGFRATEIAALAQEHDPLWATDPAAAAAAVLANYPGGLPVSTLRVNAAVDEFQQDSVTGEPDWITQNNGVRILNFNNLEMDRPAGRALAQIVNRCLSDSDQPRLILNELENIELSVVDIYLEQPDLSADITVTNHFEDHIPITGPVYAPGAIAFDLDQSNVIFGDYSINGDGYTATGTLCIVSVQNQTAVMDMRAGNNIASGELTLSAELDNNQIVLQYRNSTPSDAHLKLIVRRWLSNQ